MAVSPKIDSSKQPLVFSRVNARCGDRKVDQFMAEFLVIIISMSHGSNLILILFSKKKMSFGEQLLDENGGMDQKYLVNLG